MNEPDGGRADQHEFDLRAAVRGLAAAPAQAGRRQTVLLRHGGLTVILFTFDAGAGLPDHRAPGVDTIHVLDGRAAPRRAVIRLAVRCPPELAEAVLAELLVLAPGVRHDVVAEVQSTMLLQVYLDDAIAVKQ